jgi:hypothetical protein
MTAELKRKDKLLLAVAEMLGPWLIRGLGFLCRYQVMGGEHLIESQTMGKGVILALWHGRMLLPVYHLRGRGITSLISLHRDGELIARIVKRLGYIPRRGSSREGGREGFNAMVRDLKAGKTVAIFPDGPTGPRHHLRDGIVQLARITGAPIVPLSFSARPVWRLKSWDSYTIMKPFSRGWVRMGEPLVIPRHIATDDQLELFRTQVRDALIAIEAECDRLAGVV